MRARIPPLLSALLAFGTFAALLEVGRRHPLRKHITEPLPRHYLRNFLLTAFAGLTVHLTQKPIVQPLSALVEQRHWGLLQIRQLPRWLEAVLAVVLMDYSLYWWHVLLHRVPWLWRCHIVHHTDLKLDTSTALRFHFGEMVASVPWRAAQVLLFGVTPKTLALWQKATLYSVMFHHSNMRLPLALERWLSRLITTPRLHGIHHSIVEAEEGTNLSSGLIIWDYLHDTLRKNVPQDAVTIGVPAYRNPRELTVWNLLKLPFVRQRPSWQLPGDGPPERGPLPAPRTRLAP